MKKRITKWIRKWLGIQAEIDYFENDSQSELYDRYMFDFYQPLSFSETVQWTGSTKNDNTAMAKKKIEVKPIDVLNELETVPTPFTIQNLDEKIEMLKAKESIISQKHSKREVSALIKRLQNRKKYEKHRTFFERFNNTTKEKIDVLLDKYDLVMKSSDIFIPEFPEDAIKVMNEYITEVKDICDQLPVFYVIATSDNFREKYKDRDPILLVQSPFGFYWQILGAWDKEMLILHEL